MHCGTVVQCLFSRLIFHHLANINLAESNLSFLEALFLEHFY